MLINSFFPYFNSGDKNLGFNANVFGDLFEFSNLDGDDEVIFINSDQLNNDLINNIENMTRDFIYRKSNNSNDNNSDKSKKIDINKIADNLLGVVDGLNETLHTLKNIKKEKEQFANGVTIEEIE
jgi:hypothetical protein